MSKTRIAIACQGGGSHTAFTAGALKHLFSKSVHEKYDVVGLTGTSGGAICATAAWYGLAREANGAEEPPYKTLIDFWLANTPQTPLEQWFTAMTGFYLKISESGRVPLLPPNPYRDAATLEAMMPFFERREFLDFRALLESYIDFDELRSMITETSPRLLLGAVNILTGRFKAFDSRVPGEISVDAVLASAAVPEVFKAVHIGEDLYWDGLFSQNPPVAQLLATSPETRPDEIWVILINSPELDEEPTTIAEINDRRNELAGNISLYQEIHFIERVNHWIEQDYFRPEKVGELKPIRIRWIRMSKPLSDTLTYSTKLKRDAEFIEMLIRDGEDQAAVFLSELEQAQEIPPSTTRKAKRQATAKR